MAANVKCMLHEVSDKTAIVMNVCKWYIHIP